jgi:carboxymethylenebutenolidase
MTLGHSGSDLELPVEDGNLSGYVAVPASGRGPGVLVLHEAWGLVDHVRDVCDRLARAGFVALAPDLYRGQVAEDLSEARRLASQLESERVGADLDAGVAALLNHAGVDGPRVGVVGFCMGGHLALLTATRSARVAAAVDFYGMLPQLPLDFAGLEAAVLAIFAENDEYIDAEAVESLRASFRAAGQRATIHVQPGVGHAFMNDARPDCHDAAAAAQGWDRMLAFLRAELR